MHEKKAFSVAPKASPWRPNHVTICLLRQSGESLQNGQLELRRRRWYFVRETHKDTAVSFWASVSGRILKDYRNIVSASTCGFASEIALRKVLATQMGDGDAAQPKKVSSFESCINTPLSPHRGSISCAGSSCIIIPGVVCELLHTVRGNTAVGRHS